MPLHPLKSNEPNGSTPEDEKPKKKKRDARRVSKMDTFGRNGKHPTRTNPQTRKLTTTPVTFFKTLARVAKYWKQPTENPLPNRSGALIAVGLMPFIVDHYRWLRRDVDTSQHERKEVTDAVGCEIPTLLKYSYLETFHPGLSKRKHREIAYALEVLERGTQITIEEIIARLGANKDDRTVGIAQ